MQFDFSKEVITQSWKCHSSYDQTANIKQCEEAYNCKVEDKCCLKRRQKVYKLYREMKKGMNSKWHSSKIS